MRTHRLAALAVSAVALVGVSCGSDDPSAPSTTGPPWGLDGVDLPDDPAAVEGVLGAFPEELDGLELSEVSPTQVSYGDGSTFVRAIELAQLEANGFPAPLPGASTCWRAAVRSRSR